MVRVACSRDVGGFSLSQGVWERLAEVYDWSVEEYDEDGYKGFVVRDADGFVIDEDDLERDNALLCDLIEEFGEDASPWSCSVGVVEFDGDDFRIACCDEGAEAVLSSDAELEEGWWWVS